MPQIKLEHVTRRWGGFYGVDDLSMTIDDNAFVTLLGPSGCGKTTTLRMIAGLETPTSGRITIGDQVVFDSSAGINVPANKRRVGFLFQNYALWPNMTVYKNIAFGLANVKEDLPTIDEKAQRAAGMLRALGKPRTLRDHVLDARGKKGGLDTARACLRLIDAYEVSMSSAKELVGLGVHTASDPDSVAKAAAARYSQTLDAARAARTAAGETLTDDFQVVGRDGAVRSTLRKLSSEEIDLRVRRVGRIVKVGQFMDRYPSELSGGQQQRVAIARTLAPEPGVLFMDEPLSNLDAKLRLGMRAELQRLHIDTGSTFVYVTHDQMEAMTLATRICLMDNGVLQQYEEPLTVYSRPANLFVADFVGNPSINFIDAAPLPSQEGTLPLAILGGAATVGFRASESFDPAASAAHEARLDEEAAAAERARQQQKGAVAKENKQSRFRYHVATVEDVVPEADEVESDDDGGYVLGVRPEFVAVSEQGMFEAEVYSSMPAGMETTLRVRVGDFLLTSVMFGGPVHQIGQRVRVDLTGDAVMLFSRASGRLVAQGTLEAL